MNGLLLVILAILIGNALIGRKVGFIKTVFSLFSLIVALIITVWVNPAVNDMMRGNEKVYGYIVEKVESVLPFDTGEEDTDLNAQVTYIEGLPLPQSIKDTLIQNNNSDVYGALEIENDFHAYISNYLASIIINALSFVVTFIAILIVLWVICTALNIVSKLPVLNQVNKTAGLAAGLVHGLVIVWVFFILITVFGGTQFGKITLKMVEDSQILSFIYNNNLLLGFVTSATKMLF